MQTIDAACVPPVSRETLADAPCANRRPYRSPAREHQVAIVKEALVQAVITLAQEGRYRASARQIAAVAEVHVRAIYRHFGSAELLYRVVAREHWQEIPLPLGHDPKDLVWAILVGEPRDTP